MLLSTVVVAFLVVSTGTAASQVTCNTLGETACPYPAATTSDLESAIATFCGDDGGYAYYENQEILDVELPEGYYSISSDLPGGFNQTVCNTALNKMVDYCTATGFWIESIYVVQVNGNQVTFDVINCQLA